MAKNALMKITSFAANPINSQKTEHSGCTESNSKCWPKGKNGLIA